MCLVRDRNMGLGPPLEWLCIRADPGDGDESALFPLLSPVRDSRLWFWNKPFSKQSGRFQPANYTSYETSIVPHVANGPP